MRDTKQILIDLSKFYSKIATIGYSMSFEQDKNEFLKLRDEIQQKYPNTPMFKKPIYFETDFDYNYNLMRNQCSDMIELLLSKI